jgi:hypothetical protein
MAEVTGIEFVWFLKKTEAPRIQFVEIFWVEV